MRISRWSVIGPLIGVVLLVGWACANTGAPPNACPKTLTAEPDSGSSRIQVGPDTTKFHAVLTSLAVECFPRHTPAIEAGEAKVPARTTYRLAATARVEYAVVDSAWFASASRRSFQPFQVTVIFEVLSPNGVILREQRNAFQVVRAERRGTVSATIDGLSEEEIRRVGDVRVRWLYQ